MRVRVNEHLMSFTNFSVPYPADERYAKKIAYFSMEFATHHR
jgi:starch phosphorylase